MFNLSEVLSTKNDVLSTKIKARLDDLTKPPGSLGYLETLVLQYCLCKKNENASLKNIEMYTFAADHGITQEKVAPYPKEVTMQMVVNMINGGAAVSVLSKNAGITYRVVDIGVDADFAMESPVFIKQKVAKGTKSFLKESAMTQSECERAMQVGYDLALASKADIIGVGEMGIGNTSSASALYSMILDIPAEETVGAGTGATGDLLAHKKSVISQAVAFHKKQWNGSALDALCRVGGLEIAGICGMIFGAAEKGIPVVVDGFIASAAALVALKTNSAIIDCIVFSHESNEKFHREFFRNLGIRPVLSLDMRLGEGTGAVLAMQIMQQAMNCYHEMATFSSAHVDGKK